MNIRGLLTLLLAGLAGPLCAAPQIGQAAPDFAGTDTAGQVQRLSDYHGRTVVLEWTNHDCPYVRKHYGSGTMQALQRDAVAQGVVWLSIISSAPGKQGHVSAAQADALTRDRDASPSAVVLDEQGEIGRLYGAKTTPHMFVVDADGVHGWHRQHLVRGSRRHRHGAALCAHRARAARIRRTGTTRRHAALRLLGEVLTSVCRGRNHRPRSTSSMRWLPRG